MIIGLGHKIKSGKDTVANMIRFLVEYNRISREEDYETSQSLWQEYLDFCRVDDLEYKFQVKRFADKIKGIVCLLIGCTLEQLEDHNFKNTILPEEWDKWVVWNKVGFKEHFDSYSKANEVFERFSEGNAFIEKIPITPRLLFNLIGTESGRKIIHPNIWVNALFSSYQQKIFNYRSSLSTYYEEIGHYKIDSHPSIPKEHWGKEISTRDFEWAEHKYPDWIITDVRFPNEVSAIKRKEGIVVKVQRDFCFDTLEDYLVTYPDKNTSKKAAQLVSEFKGTYPELLEHFAKMFPEETMQFLSDSHKLESETVLDNFEEWDYIIDNNGTQEELLLKVKEFLEHYKII